jgi:hypothetical protein
MKGIEIFNTDFGQKGMEDVQIDYCPLDEWKKKNEFLFERSKKHTKGDIDAIISRLSNAIKQQRLSKRPNRQRIILDHKSQQKLAAVAKIMRHIKSVRKECFMIGQGKNKSIFFHDSYWEIGLPYRAFHPFYGQLGQDDDGSEYIYYTIARSEQGCEVLNRFYLLKGQKVVRI